LPQTIAAGFQAAFAKVKRKIHLAVNSCHVDAPPILPGAGKRIHERIEDAAARLD